MQATSTENNLKNTDVRMRCPNCTKLFSVPFNEIKETEPKFNCNACQTQFTISLREALETISPESPEVYSCPKCKSSYMAGDIECKKCGVIFLKFEEVLQKSYSQQNEDAFAPSREVRELWDEILIHYDDYNVHQNFINAAWADQSLDYAARKYATILEMLPMDEYANRAQKEIVALTLNKFAMSKEFAQDTSVASVDVMALAKRGILSFRHLKITNIIMFLCGVLIFMGLLLPHMRNLVGFGFAILGFILVLRYYFRAI